MARSQHRARALAGALLVASCTSTPHDGSSTGDMTILPSGGASGAAGTAAPTGGSGGSAGIGGQAGASTSGIGGMASGSGGAGVIGGTSAGADASDGGAMTPDGGEVEPEDAGMIDPPVMDLGEGDGSDVVTIGDSWMSNTLLTGNAIEGALARLTGQSYRNYAAQGVELLQGNLFGGAIPTQYTRAKREDPNISTVVMTGGGNDIIQNASVQASCDEGGEACKEKLAEIAAALNTLWTEMSDDGVKNVVYVRYADDANTTDDSVRDMTAVPPICITGPIRCHSIDSTDAVMGELQDGIHPTRAANDRLAKVIHDYMIAEGIRR